MSGFTRFTVVTLLLLSASIARADYETSRIGGVVRYTERTDEVTCAAGSFVVGFRFKGGTYVDDIQLKCARPSGTNTLGRTFDGPSTTTTINAVEILPGVSSREKTVFCPQHHVVSGIKAQGGDYVDRINSIRCTRYGGTAVQFRNVGIGGNGGHTVRAYCSSNPGDIIKRFRVKAGLWVDSLRTTCGPQ